MLMQAEVGSGWIWPKSASRQQGRKEKPSCFWRNPKSQILDQWQQRRRDTGGEPKWGRAGSGRKVPPVNTDVKKNLADSDAIPNPRFWINGSNGTCMGARLGVSCKVRWCNVSNWIELNWIDLHVDGQVSKVQAGSTRSYEENHLW